jgi:hypothetical protein
MMMGPTCVARDRKRVTPEQHSIRRISYFEWKSLTPYFVPSGRKL